jgi:hypothetical protein
LQASASFFLWRTGWNNELSIWSFRLSGLAQPLANFVPSICRNFREPQAPRLVRLIHPNDLSGEFDLLHGIGRNAKLNWPPLSQRRRDVETKTVLGGIEDDTASFRFELDIGEFFRSLPGGTSAFRLH